LEKVVARKALERERGIQRSERERTKIGLSARTNSEAFRRGRTEANEDERQKKEKTRRETFAIRCG
jgi:hypothetical protein